MLVRQDVGLVLRELMVVRSSGSCSSLWSRVVGDSRNLTVVVDLAHSIHKCDVC